MDIGNKESSAATVLGRFTMVSFAATVIVGALLGTIAAHVVEDYAYRERAQTMAFYVSQFLAPRLRSQDFARRGDDRRAGFEAALRALIGRAGIHQVTVWNAQAELLYTSNTGLPGRGGASSLYVRDALAGRIAWRRADTDRSASVHRDDLEVFIPVLASASSHPVAAYAVIATASDLPRAVARLQQWIWLSVVFGLLVLYTTQFSVVYQAARDLERQRAAVGASLIGTIRSLARAVDARDLATGNHSSRVAEYAEAIARGMGLSASEIRDAQAAGYLHDVGKIGVPDAILTKRGHLSEDEWIAIQQHSVGGYEILRPVPIPERIKLAVRHNHECWDGSGYPDRLAGEQIPLLARVVAVADAYEALTTDRPYRAAWQPQDAIDEIRRCSGTQFDPRAVDALLRVFRAWAVRPQEDAPPQRGVASAVRPPSAASPVPASSSETR